MCDVKKYEKIYEDIQKLQPEDTLQNKCSIKYWRRSYGTNFFDWY